MRRGWRLFRATDFQSLMRPCFTFCRILGIFPYRIDNSIFGISKPHYAASIVITCTLCGFELSIFHRHSGIANFEDVILSFEANCYGVLSSFVAIVTLASIGPRMRLLQTLMGVSSRLAPESYRKLSRLIHFKDIFGFIYLAGLIFVDFFITDMSVFFFIFSEYTALLVFQMDMLYMNCVCVLKACLKEINDNLLHMRESIANGGPCVSTVSHREQKYLRLIVDVKILRKQHLMISDAIQMLNAIFSLQLLATIVMTSFEIIFALYFHLVKWDNGLLINLDKNMSLFLTSVTYHIIRILLLVWACETGKNEARKIRTVIHDVLNSTRNKRIKNELHLFSLQTLHCKSTFLARGFTIDATFLTVMTSTLVTYTLISLQFLIMSHSC